MNSLLTSQIPEAAVAVLEHRHDLVSTIPWHADEPSAQDQERINRARKIMGERVQDMSDEELGSHLIQFLQLIDYWLDEFEQQQFDGSTLKQLF